MGRRASVVLGLFPMAAVASSASASAATLQVGPGKTYNTPCAAILAAQAGDTVEVDGSGSYNGDTCSWSTDNLTIVGVNGRPKIDLTGVTPSGQKGIFTISANNTAIINFELSGAAISASAGNNGAGIRFQGLNLTLQGCYLHDNQDGILAAPATANTGRITIDSTEFANNGAGDGYSHNVYIGNFAQFTMQYSYSHGAKVGHLYKSRAYTSYVLYNRLTDEAGATASYEVDLPNGGTAYVIGNIIEQSAASQNSTIITFGEEGIPSGYDTHLFVINNTVLNDLGSGTFVADSSATPGVVMNNIFWNGGNNCSQASAMLTTNFDSSMGNPMFVDVANYNVHLLAGSPCIDKGTMPGQNGSQSLAPVYEYVHPLGDVPRAVVGSAIDIGAYEYGNPADAGAGNDAGSLVAGEAGSDGAAPSGTGGSEPTDGAVLTDSGADSSETADGAGGDARGASGAASADGGLGPTTGSSGGCGCELAGRRFPSGKRPRGEFLFVLFLVSVVALLARSLHGVDVLFGRFAVAGRRVLRRRGRSVATCLGERGPLWVVAARGRPLRDEVEALLQRREVSPGQRSAHIGLHPLAQGGQRACGRCCTRSKQKGGR